MFKLLAFLIILVILFGVEATRAFVFGTLGLVGWLLVAFLVFAIISSVIQSYKERTGKAKREYLAGVVGFAVGAATLIYAISTSAGIEGIVGAIMFGFIAYVIIAPGGDDAKPKKEPTKAKDSPSISWKGWLVILLITAFLLSPLLLLVIK